MGECRVTVGRIWFLLFMSYFIGIIILFYHVFIDILQKEHNLIHDLQIYLTKFVVMTFKAQNKLPYYVIMALKLWSNERI